MKAIIIDEEKNFVSQEQPDPVTETGRVVIDIHAAALNRADLLQREGKYPPPPGWPAWPGLECAGVISAVPAESRWKIGDRVCALLGGGGYAEKVSVPENMVMPMPENLSFSEAAALPEVYTTAFMNLGALAKLQQGETLFVQAGASGLGIAAIQLAKHLFHAKVVTTVGSEEKAAAVQALGADVVINRKTACVAEILTANPPDVALDCAGGEILANCLRAMRSGGRWILVSTLGGEFANIPLRVILKQHLSLIGSTLRSRSDAEKGEILAQLVQQVWPLIRAEKFAPLIDKVFPAAEVDAAHAVLQKQKNIGKVVLTFR